MLISGVACHLFILSCFSFFTIFLLIIIKNTFYILIFKIKNKPLYLYQILFYDFLFKLYLMIYIIYFIVVYNI